MHENVWRKQVKVDNKYEYIDIYPMESEYQHYMLEMYSRECDGVILMYDIISQSNFDEAVKMKMKCIPNDFEKEIIPMVFVGNKLDLADKREVSYEQGEKFAVKWNCPFLEISTKRNINLEELFESIVREIRKKPKVENVEKHGYSCQCKIM